MSELVKEEYIFEAESKKRDTKYLTVIIYDIIDNKRRNRMVKLLERYGYRVQKSAFEALIDNALFQKLISEIPEVVSDSDNVKAYRLKGVSETYTWGCGKNINSEDVIFI